MFRMLMLLVALTTSFILFVCLIASVRFLFSPRGIYWILPLIITALFFFISLAPLKMNAVQVYQGTYPVQISPDTSVREVIPLVIVMLWATLLIIHNFLLSILIPKKTFQEQRKRNLDEARYIQEKEYRRYRQNLLRDRMKQVSIAQETGGDRYPVQWITYYDQY